MGPEINAGLDAWPIQKMCGTGSVPGPDFWGEILTSLLPTLSSLQLTSPRQWRRNYFQGGGRAVPTTIKLLTLELMFLLGFWPLFLNSYEPTRDSKFCPKIRNYPFYMDE